MWFGNPSRPCSFLIPSFTHKTPARIWCASIVGAPANEIPPKILPLTVTAPAFQASAQTSMPHHFFEQTQPTTKTLAIFCKSNDATRGAHQDCRNCESSMASNRHPITPSAGTTTSTRNRRRQHTRTRLDGGHKPPSHPTTASRPAQHHQRKEASRNSATEKKKNDDEFHTLQPALSHAGTSS